MPFSVDFETIEDLFYDGETNPDMEYSRLLDVLDANNTELIFQKVFKIDTFNRLQFVKLAIKLTNTDVTTASEIFSCATECFDQKPSNNNQNNNNASLTSLKDLPDCCMTPSQFTNAIIRVANLKHLTNNGFDQASVLSTQLTALINDIECFK